MWNVRLCPKKGTFDTLLAYTLNPFPSSISVSGFLSHLRLKIPIHFPRIVQKLKQPCKIDQSKEWQNCHQLEDTWGSVGKISSYIVECIAGKIDYGTLLENISSKTFWIRHPELPSGFTTLTVCDATNFCAVINTLVDQDQDENKSEGCGTTYMGEDLYFIQLPTYILESAL